jgi:hypothetical protein
MAVDKYRSGIVFDPSFIEEAVFLLMTDRKEDDGLLRGFHREREVLYRDVPDEGREVAFQKFYAGYFKELGAQSSFEQLVAEVPSLGEAGVLVFVKRAWSKKQEDTELYVRDGSRILYVALMALRVKEPGFMTNHLRHELLRASDMLDPCFQYDPGIELAGKNEMENNLIRGRFRLLWDMFIAARIRNKGHPAVRSVEAHKREFERVFFYFEEKRRAYILSTLAACREIRHSDLLGWAQDARGIRSLGEGGLRCPLCDFTSYDPVSDWPQGTSVVVDEIMKDHPQWSQASGICPQCFELYRCRAVSVG